MVLGQRLVWAISRGGYPAHGFVREKLASDHWCPSQQRTPGWESRLSPSRAARPLCVFPRELWPSFSHAPGPSPASHWECWAGFVAWAKGWDVLLPGQLFVSPGKVFFFFFFLLLLMAVFIYPLGEERLWTQLQTPGQGKPPLGKTQSQAFAGYLILSM